MPPAGIPHKSFPVSRRHYKDPSDIFSEEQKNIFYAYFVIRTDFRGEIIQTNGQVGFANFLNYQNRNPLQLLGQEIIFFYNRK